MLTRPEWTISYNPDTTEGMMGDADGGPETALIVDDYPHGMDGHMWTGRAFFILKGDFRRDYAALADGGADKWNLIAFYRTQRKRYGSRHSTDFHEWGRDGKVRS